jgi:nitric oxide reductase large subunit
MWILLYTVFFIAISYLAFAWYVAISGKTRQLSGKRFVAFIIFIIASMAILAHILSIVSPYNNKEYQWRINKQKEYDALFEPIVCEQCQGIIGKRLRTNPSRVIYFEQDK